jgi:hypothetical protein
MIIYEITAIVEQHLIDDYEKYMREQHIPDLLATGYFAAAFLTTAESGRYRVQYHARDRNALDSYLSKEAERLREDFLTHFPEGITVTRENWEILQAW